jgi:DNA-binding transcriptional LysR family regulator
MNFNQLNCFVNLAETLNFTETAEKLHLTQPAVTKIVHQLEVELGVQLFERDKRSVKLTESGQIFYKDMSEVLLETQNTLNKLNNHVNENNRMVSIGYTSTAIEEKLLPKVLRKIKTEIRDIHVDLHNFELNSGIEKLMSNKLDLLLTTQDNVSDNKDIEFLPISNGNFVCVFSKDKHVKNTEMLEMDDLNDRNIILFNTRQAPPEQVRVQNAIKSRFPESRFQIGDNISIVLTLVKGNLGMAVLPDFLVDADDPEIQVIPLDYSGNLKYGIAYRKNNDNQIMIEMIKIIQNILEKEIGR